MKVLYILFEEMVHTNFKFIKLNLCSVNKFLQEIFFGT